MHAVNTNFVTPKGGAKAPPITRVAGNDPTSDVYFLINHHNFNAFTSSAAAASKTFIT